MATIGHSTVAARSLTTPTPSVHRGTPRTRELTQTPQAHRHLEARQHHRRPLQDLEHAIDDARSGRPPPWVSGPDGPNDPASPAPDPVAAGRRLRRRFVTSDTSCLGSRPWSSPSPTSTKRSPPPAPTRSAWSSATDGSPGARSPIAPADFANHLLRARASAAASSGRARRATRAARTTSRSTCTTATSTSKPCSASFKARVAPFNVNYRYVAEELRYLLTDSQRDGDRRAQPVRAHAGRGAARPAEPAGHPAGARRVGQRPAARRRVVRGRARRGVGRAARRARGAPTTSTSSTPAAPPACRRVCCGATPTPTSSASAASRADTIDGIVGEAVGGLKALLAPPFMHGAGHWMSFRTWNTGGTRVRAERARATRPAPTSGA